jgi:glycosyltransferase involved in cell wall biosynthesis
VKSGRDEDVTAMRAFRALSYRLKTALFDWSFQPMVGWGLACAQLGAFVARQRLGRKRAVRHLLRAHYMLLRTDRFDASTSRLYRAIEHAIRGACATPGPVHATVAASDAPAAVDAADFGIAGLVLKAPRYADGRVVEKGVLLLKNTERLRVVRRCVDVAAVLRDYVLVLEPSWSGLANLEVLYFTRFSDHRIIVMATGEQDLRFLERLESNLLPVPLGSSDWADPSIFRPLEGAVKRYDAVLVARWTMMKRHHLLFRTLRRLRDPSFRVALIAGSWPTDTDREAILALAELYGVAGQISVFENLTQEGVNAILNESKVNVLLSRQEGSSRALFEGFFAGVPGLALATNVGLPRPHFTPQTGRLVAEPELAATLIHFREHWADYEPRSWAQAHIAPAVSTARLNALLQDLARRRGEPWTRDIVAKCNCPRLRYYPNEDAGRGLATMEDLLARYPGPDASRIRRDIDAA